MMPIRPETPGLPPVTLIQALLPAAGSGDQASQAAQWINQLQIGQRIIAVVQAHLTDGSFLVKVGDTTTRMNLPSATMVGEKITLTVVDKTPLPTFILNANPAVTIDSSSMSLSTTGKLIATILQQPNESVPAPIMGKMPIMPQADISVPQLAYALQQTLTQSGLFYESHLNQWVSGRRTITELMQEPQANQTVQISVNPTAVNAAALLTATVVDPASATAMTNSVVTSAASAASASPRAVDTTINNPVLAQLVHQQLHTLEQNRVMWQGELWAGQMLEWEVSDDTPKDNTIPSQSVWSSKVSFEMPVLGKIVAHLRLNGEQLTMQIHADTPATAQQLRGHGTRLNTALETAGISLASLQVKADA